MKLESQIVYPRPPAEVSTMTFDPKFQDLKCEATGADSYTVDVSSTGDRTTITTERDMSTASFPDYLKSFVGSSLKVIQVDVWGPPSTDGSRTGTTTVTLAGKPVKLTGDLALSPSPDGAVSTVSADLKASVPLIGARVEKAAAPAILAAVRAEQKTATQWFADH